jgi:4-amino-4-deoxy-L-arabinose transferase-like glycosyltransferase
MENRAGGLSKIIVWLAWLVVIVILVAEPFRWEVRYFRIHGGQGYYLAIIALLALLIPFCILYVRWRRRGWYRYELPAIATGALLLMIVEQPRALIVGALLFVACLVAGMGLARLLGVVFSSAGERVGVGFSLGAALLIPVLFILGLLHAYYWPIFLLLLLCPLAFFRRDAMDGLRALGGLWREATGAEVLAHPWCGIGVLFLAAGVLCAAMAAVTPTLVFDALKMHLVSTQTYVAVHALQPVPLLPYSYYPQGFEVLMSAAFALGGLPAAQMITPIFFVAFLLILVEIAKLCEFDSAAILAALACLLMTPFIIWSGSQVKNDMELAMFQVAALYCCLRWRASEQRSWLMAGAFLLAATFGIKHIAAFGAVPLALLFVAPLYRKPRAVRTAAMFFLIVAVFGFYWHTRTFLMTGDPMFPRHVEDAIKPKAKLARSLKTWVKRRVGEPLRLQLNDHRIAFESPVRSPMGIVVLMFAPLALLVPRRRNGSRMACWFYIGLNLLLWGARMTTLRYALAPIALLIVLIASKAKDAYDLDWAIAPAMLRFSIAVAFAFTLAYGLLGTILVEIVPGQLQFLAHRMSRDQYLSANLPIYAPLPAIRKLDPHATVMFMGGCPRGYAPDPMNSACGGSKHGGVQHRQELLNGHGFQYVVLPADLDDDERGVIFAGWKTEDVYADDDWRGMRITRNP